MAALTLRQVAACLGCSYTTARGLLTGPDPIQWPTLTLDTPVSDLTGVQKVPVAFTLTHAGAFRLGRELRMAFSFHKGWDRAEARVLPLDPTRPEQTLSATCALPQGSPMLAIYGGVDIHFGRFVRTLQAHRYLYAGSWADPIRVKD